MQKIIAVCTAVIGANLLFFHRPFLSLGTVGFFLSVLLAETVLALSFFSKQKSSHQSEAFTVLLISIICAGLSLFHANEVDTFLLALGSFLTFLLSWYLFALTHDSYGALSEIVVIPTRLASTYFGAVTTLLGIVPTMIRTGSHTFYNRLWKNVEHRFPVHAILRGVILTVLVLFVLVGLLSSADPVFGSIVGSLFSFSLPNLIIAVPERVLFSLLITALVSPLAVFHISKRFSSPFQHERYSAWSTELSMVTYAVAVILGLFLIIQVRYLFFAIPDITLHSFGIQTYSEYVRKGFGELILTSVFVYSVVALSMIVVRHSKSVTLRNANLIVLSEVLLLILSVFRRLALYQVTNGLTRIRIYGSVFLVILIVLTILLILRHVTKHIRHFYRYEIGVVFSGLLLIGVLNVDHIVGSLFRPTVNNEIDYTYISSLSPDAVDGWLDAIVHVEDVVKDPSAQPREIVYAWRTIHSLDYKLDHLYSQYGSTDEQNVFTQARGYTRIHPTRQTVLTLNFSELQAYQSIRRTISIENFFELEKKVDSRYATLTPVEQQGIYDRSSVAPLIQYK